MENYECVIKKQKNFYDRLGIHNSTPKLNVLSTPPIDHEGSSIRLQIFNKNTHSELISLRANSIVMN